MTQPLIARKGTFFWLTGPVDHLHIIINDPVFCPEAGHELVVAVNITSMTERHDPACVLEAGCHPFITHPSYVFYRDASAFSATKLAAGVAAGEVRTHEAVDEALYEKVLEGFKVSRFVKPRIKRFLRNHAKLID
jgi:hypothetical protein